MIKRILINIVLIIIIFTTFVYGTDELILSPSIDDTTIEKKTDTEEPIPSSTPSPTQTDKPTPTVEPIETPEIKPTSTPEIIKPTPTIKATQEPIIEQPILPEETIYIPRTQIDVVTKSNDCNLKELKIDIEGLTPDFNKNTTEYYLVVDLSIEDIQVTAIPTDEKARVSIKGNNNLEEGENTITITVTAEDETIKNYYIYVTKIDNIELANAELETLEIQGFSLYPSFKSKIFSYNLNINEAITNLDVIARPQREKATVVIEGNSNLHEGENIIKVVVTAEDGTTIRTYKINTYIDSSAKVIVEEESKMPAIILIVLLSTAILILGTFIIIKKRK